MSSFLPLLFLPGESALFSYSSSIEITSGCDFCAEVIVVLGILILNGMLPEVFASVCKVSTIGYGAWKVSSTILIGFDIFLSTLFVEGIG
jgi:Na+/H+ antiporter NhaC